MAYKYKRKLSRKKKTSLKDIAKEAGVSIATVSYVLSKRENSGVSVAVAEKIEKIARELNYTPNLIAKSLQSGKTYTIGLLVADISNPFFASIARVAEDEAKKKNYTVVFGSSDEKGDRSSDLINFLLDRQVDGLIITPAEDTEEQINTLLQKNIPFVLIDRYFPSIDTNYVMINNLEVSYAATERLILNGNEKIGVVSYNTKLFHMEQRVNGYDQAMKKHCLSYKPDWKKEVEYINIEEEVSKAVNELLTGKDPVTAIFFATNSLAVEGLKEINRIGLTVPDDVAVIAFDESDVFDFFYSPITHIRQPISEIGSKAVEILLEEINSKNPIQKRKVELEADLVVRDSCTRS